MVALYFSTFELAKDAKPPRQAALTNIKHEKAM